MKTMVKESANNRLKGMFKLSSKVEIIVPSTVNVGELIDNTEYVNRVATKLSNMFGGATATNSQGFYVSDEGNLIKENSTIVYSYCTEDDLENNLDDIIRICEQLRDEMTQECVGLVVNGEMYFI